MSCPTCTHTMAALGYATHHCPRCGTAVMADAVITPALVTRCRNFAARPSSLTGHGEREWDRLGIPEATGHKPA